MLQKNKKRHPTAMISHKVMCKLEALTPHLCFSQAAVPSPWFFGLSLNFNCLLSLPFLRALCHPKSMTLSSSLRFHVCLAACFLFQGWWCLLWFPDIVTAKWWRPTCTTTWAFSCHPLWGREAADSLEAAVESTGERSVRLGWPASHHDSWSCHQIHS